MPRLSITLINGEEEEDMPISKNEAKAIKAGLTSGSPFSFTDDDGAWVWLNTDAIAGVAIEED